MNSNSAGQKGQKPRPTKPTDSFEEISRRIKPETERMLWAHSAGRCEFNQCNRLIYKSAITQETVNLAEMAHIYSFSPAGPRGRGPYQKEAAGLNDLRNLMLVCHDCHKTIDQDIAGMRYSAALLQRWKQEHESRIRTVTGINPSKKTHVVLYGARVGQEKPRLKYEDACEAMFPHWNPADDRAVDISMNCSHDDSEEGFWNTEANHLKKEFARHIISRSEEAQPNHFSVFALAPQPLLILLGSLLTDKVPTIVYQLHREPVTWEWQPHPDEFEYLVKEPTEKTGVPVLAFSLSGKIDPSRIEGVIQENVSIWEISIQEPHNDFLQSEAQLKMFRQTVRKLISAIQASHPTARTLYLFPAMPVSCAVELGRVRMPKADMAWKIYDQNNKKQQFIPTLTIE